MSPPPGPHSAPIPRMGDVATLARHSDRLDDVTARLSRLETKVDRALELLLGLTPNSVPRTKR
jgi:hypothetical protein